MKMKSRFQLRLSAGAVAIVLLWTASLAGRAQQAAVADPDRWEATIRTFEEQDRRTPPPKGAIVFTGASSIVRWNLQESFPDLNVINRGFGGSEMSDAARYASRIVVPYSPRIVVLYSGDNDIGRGVTPEQVEADFERFVRVVHGALPQTRIVVIGVKPSLLRWGVYDNMKKANAMMRGYIEAHKGLEYVEVGPPMLGADGKPRPELFVQDGLHLTADGYTLWTTLLRPHLK
jgi:lysophospholipase L1-like esterase